MSPLPPLPFSIFQSKKVFKLWPEVREGLKKLDFLVDMTIQKNCFDKKKFIQAIQVILNIFYILSGKADFLLADRGQYVLVKVEFYLGPP